MTKARHNGFGRSIAELFRARFPFVFVQTWEEERLLAELSTVVADATLIRTPRRLFVWTVSTGMVPVDAHGRTGAPTVVHPPSLIEALDEIERFAEPAVFVLADVQWFLGGHRRQPDPVVVRRIRNLVSVLNRQPKNVVFVAPALALPDELQKDVTVVEFPLPNRHELSGALSALVRDNESQQVTIRPEVAERLTAAALGLTLKEAENAFARAIVHTGALDDGAIEVVLEEKRQAIRKTAVLEYIDVDVDIDELGGLRTLKSWLVKRNRTWLEEARRYHVPFPKGLLITGIPGCGKSLAAKCTSALWQLPLLRLDVGRIFAGLVGSSEENMRTAIRMAEAVAPSILWIDEVEKGFSHTTSGLDSGVSSRVFGTFLTWMQEKRSPVFVIATANNIHALPPEFLRKGRFDEIFFVDLPTTAERRKIFEIHFARQIVSAQARGGFHGTPEVLDELAELTENYSGAEIEQVVAAALFDAFADDRRPIRVDDLRRAIAQMVPLARTMDREIDAIRAWADVRAVAATPREDRAVPRPQAGNDAMVVRGGRTIDF
jgi:SpoVK/Ycf46/Vps4 family AAA+-type ATPase